MQTEFESPLANALYPVLLACCWDQDEFDMKEQADGNSVAITLCVSRSDARVLVGTKGERVNAIKRLVNRTNKLNSFQLKERSEGDIHLRSFVRNPGFDESEFLRRLRHLAEAIELDVSHLRTDYGNNSKLYVFVATANAIDRSTVNDLNALFYAYGWAEGQKIDVKPE